MNNFSLLYLVTFIEICSVSLLTTGIIIPRLSSIAKQPIYTEGPAWHESKHGTPTLGGLSFVISTVPAILTILPLSYHEHLRNEVFSVYLILGFGLANAAIGFFDDLLKLKRKKNGGLTPLQKLFFQSLICIIFLTLRYELLTNNTSLTLFNYEFELGIFYYPVCILFMLGVINFANLTDGIDGLAATVALFIAASVLLTFGAGNLCLSFSSIFIIGTTLGFLYYNLNPAKIFMGDTGSLFLGGVLVALFFVKGIPLSLISYGAIYVIEGVSVILQVVFYKITKKLLLDKK